MKIDILFEDDFILVVNKPNNVLIHKSYYARNITTPTLLHILKEQIGVALFPVHRLDRKTSGILILAKQKEIVAEFQELFNENKIQKTYIAIVRGIVESSSIIDSPVKNPDTKVYKKAETHCKPMFSKELDIPVHPYETSRYSLVQLSPSTGRMHQLRIHLNKVSHPIVGDYKYGDRFHNRMFENEFNCHNLFLHAVLLEFTHPKSNNHIKISAPFPSDWNKIFDLFNWNLKKEKPS